MRPVVNTKPRSVSFGATPTPERLQNPRPQCPKKSISALDKENEVEEAKLYMEKLSKKGVAGTMKWLQTKMKGGEVKK